MPKVSSTRRASRAATHSGSWYTNEPEALSDQVEAWMAEARSERGPSGGAGQVTKAIIAPHAGYAYSGRTMAFAYCLLPEPDAVRTIFILGPSHHLYTERCHVSRCAQVETPLGSLDVDTATAEWLIDQHPGLMAPLDIDDDEAEHSIELHLPYVAHYLKSGISSQTGRAGSPPSGSPRLVPIVVGSLSPEREQQVGEILAPYILDPGVVFIVSSDFCHWGRRFGFQYHDPSRFEHIHESIAWLDSEGMKAIEAKTPRGFVDYLVKHSNTICGRHPIGVLLCALEHAYNGDVGKYEVRFTKYDRSSLVEEMRDSSVSYCSAVVTLDQV
jgi:AmmeMemoRadiSam system protein B